MGLPVGSQAADEVAPQHEVADAALPERGAAAEPGVPGKRTRSEAIRGPNARPRVRGPREPVGELAARGVRGGGGSLPHLDRIQQLFGRHCVRQVRAHVGGAAAEAAGALGARAYATGDAIAFAAAPDLHTAAHEAAHVVQQRGQIHLMGGIDSCDDAYEQHANAVADRVVRGESVEALLDLYAGSGRPAPGAVVQRKTYLQLSDSQQEQIDAIRDDIYSTKAEAFEQRLGQVAAIDGAAQTAANDLIQRVAQVDQAGAQAHLAQLAGSLATKAAYVAAGPLQATTPAFDASQQESIAQTWQLPPKLEADATNILDSHRTQVLGAKQPTPGGAVTKPTASNGAVREDSAYATTARLQLVPVRGGGSGDANQLFRIAQQLGANLVETKRVAFGWLLPAAAHTFHEIMAAAQDVGLPYDIADPYDHIDPYDEGALGRLSPGYFFTPQFLIVLSEVFFADDANQRQHGLALVPVDVAQRIQNDLLPRFVGVHSDADLQVVLAAGIARVLVEQMPGPTLVLLGQLISGNGLQGLQNWGQVTGHPTYTAVTQAIGAASAQLIFSQLVRGLHGGATPTLQAQMATAQGLLTGAPATPQNDAAVGFAQGHDVALTQWTQGNATAYGPNDRGLALDSTPLGALSAAEAGSLHDYTTMSYVNYHGALGSGATTPEALFGGLGAQNGDQLLARMSACKTGLDKLPVFPGPVFRGTGAAQVTNPAQLGQLRNQFSPGLVIAHKIFLSAARTLEDSFIVPCDLAFVIDDLKTPRNLQLLSSGPTMREVLFPPHARFVVTRVEDRLTPVNPGNPNHVYTGGNLWIYMREISEQKTATDRNARDQVFRDAFEVEREGRRLVDGALYDEAQIAQMTEQLPATEPRDRFDHQGPLNTVNAAQPLPTTTYDDWRAARVHMESRIGQPLTGPDLLTMHASAAAHLPGAGAGALRVAGDERGAGGAYGPLGTFTAVTQAEHQALISNPMLQVTQLGAHDAQLSPADQLAGKRTVKVEYLAGAQVAAAMGQFITVYASEFTRLQSVSPLFGQQRDEAIGVAARAQRLFISIHPFGDGNGRVSRLVMDHILLSFGVPPALLADPNQDIMVDDNAWIAEVRNGVARTEQLDRQYNG